MGAATEAATGSAASAFSHRHYSKFLDAPQISGGQWPEFKEINTPETRLL